MTEPAFDAIAEDYHRQIAENHRVIGGHTDRLPFHKLSIIKCVVPGPVRRVLDFGCGVGANLPAIAKAYPNATITAYDVSVKSVSLARLFNQQALPAVHYTDQISTLAIGAFDLVLLANVLHHVHPHERESLIGRARSLLSPEGALCVFEHNPYNPVTRHLVNTCPLDDDTELMTRHAVGRLLDCQGLRIFRSGYCLFTPPRFMLPAHIEAFLYWLPLGGQHFTCATAMPLVCHDVPRESDATKAR